jgi:circadian clock protein KaiB
MLSVDAAAADRYQLRLFISGATPRSARAIRNIKAICEEYLAGNYDLEVIDVYQQSQLMREQQIVAVPTLKKCLPAPMRLVIGDLSDKQQLLRALGLSAAD